MPRTKRPTRNVEKTGEDDDALKKLNKQVIDLKNKVDSRANMELRNVELAFKILLGSISANLLQKTVGQLKTELHFKDTTTHSSRSASHDDAPPSTVRARRSRSADASCRSVRGISTTGRSTTASTAGRRRSRSVYRTPAYNKNAALNYPPITPKVDPQTPLTVLRQPRQGEMVVSMSGSPVMVPACYSMQPSEKATCNILLRDGTTLSLQPKQLRQSQAYIPFTLMDSRVLDQLRTLKDNLDKVVKLGEKVIVQ
ncbi:uncharacterized protein LOC116775379 isoform X2 [Danaus plexippus]|uniref:uncharacterized protein LOC116775379 isoform X2 n=1 Tax=Danaus plexippus TaxID=13037 RepID=UPI002AB1A60E|nr:uncharacterized protein LOC116775379 isoform X2 [Danaus plexippus]